MDGGRRKKTMGKGPEWFKYIRSFAVLFFFPVDNPSHPISFPSVTHLFPAICIYCIYSLFHICLCGCSVYFILHVKSVWLFLLTVGESVGHGE